MEEHLKQAKKKLERREEIARTRRKEIEKIEYKLTEKIMEDVKVMQRFKRGDNYKFLIKKY